MVLIKLCKKIQATKKGKSATTPRKLRSKTIFSVAQCDGQEVAGASLTAINKHTAGIDVTESIDVTALGGKSGIRAAWEGINAISTTHGRRTKLASVSFEGA